MKNPLKKTSLSLKTKSDLSDLQFVAEMQRKLDAYERSFDELAAFAISPENACLTGTNHPKGSEVTMVYKFFCFIAKNYPEAINAWRGVEKE